MTYKHIIIGESPDPMPQASMHFCHQKQTDSSLADSVIGTLDPLTVCSIARNCFRPHPEIVRLPEVTIHAAPEHEHVAVRVAQELRSCLDDLGNSVADAWDGVEQTARNLHRFPMAPTSQTLFNAHEGERAICLGAGPSAQAALEWLPSVVGKVRIFACDALCHELVKRGIKADYICSVERCPEIAVLQNPAAGEYLIAPPVVHHKAAAQWENVLWWLQPDPHLSWFIGDFPPVQSCPSSGVLTVAAALHAGCEEVYLIGHDLCFDGDRSHMDGAHSLALAPASSLDGKQYQTSVIEHAGYRTTSYWVAFARAIGHLTQLHKGQKVHRFGDGLPISGVFQWEKLCTLGVIHPQNLAKIEHNKEFLCAGPMLPGWISASSMLLERLERVIRDLLLTDLSPSELAKALQIRQWCPPASVSFFSSIFQSLYSAMHLRLNAGKDHAETVKRLAATLHGHAHAIAKAMRALAIDMKQGQQ